MKKLTIESIKERLKTINPNIEILDGEYINSQSLLNCKCLIDGYVWKVRWNNLQRKKGCPVCYGNVKLSIEKIKEELRLIHPNILILSNEYKNAHGKLECVCLIDGYSWTSSWTRLQSGAGCSRCSNVETMSIEDIRLLVKSLTPNIEIVSDIHISNSVKLKCVCKIETCKYEWETGLLTLRKGHGCPRCGGWERLNLTEDERLLKRSFNTTKNIKFRVSVFERDNYMCQICGDRTKINAHHLDGYHWAVKRRFDIDNGITLCSKCHNEFHDLFGRRRNTERQFFEFYKYKMFSSPTQLYQMLKAKH